MNPPLPRYVPLRVVEVTDETPDARSFVLEPPPDEREAFAYVAGQYCTFKVDVDGNTHLRCYSMSSSPDVDEPLRTTVKRVPDGMVSNWLNDEVEAGDILLATPPAGTFVLDPDDDRPLVAFAGGSGVTPVASIVKSALATTCRPVRMLLANRDAESEILGTELERVAQDHPDRFELVHHLDDAAGFVDAARIAELVGDDLDVAVYLCGPTPFMDLVEEALQDLGHDPALVRTERFVLAEPATTEPTPDAATAAAPDAAPDATIELTLTGGRHTLEHRDGETILEAARRGGLNPPFSCQAGNCATCIAELTDGEVRMRVNDILTPDEVAEGWILTCQSLPTTPSVTVVYPD